MGQKRVNIVEEGKFGGVKLDVTCRGQNEYFGIGIDIGIGIEE